MSESHAIVTTTAPTGSPPITQDITDSALNGNILGAIGVMTEPQDTPIRNDFVDVQFHIGSTDMSSLNNQMVGINYEDNVAASDAKTLSTASSFLAAADTAGDDTVNISCDYDSAITNGLRLNWDTLSTARIFSSILFKEGIENFNAQTVTFAGTGSTTITAGFTPDVIIIFSTGQPTPSFGNNEIDHGIQFYHRTDAVYAGYFVGANHNSTSPDSAVTHSSVAVGGNLSTTPTLDDEYTIGNFTGTGFDVTKVAQTNSQVNMVVSIQLTSGYSAKVGTATAPTSTGVWSLISGLSFQPQIALLSSLGGIGTNNPTNGAAWNFGACVSDAEFSAGGRIAHFGGTVSNADASGWHRDDSCIFYRNSVGTLRSQAAFDSFQSDGLDVNFSTADEALTIPYLVIGTSAAPASNNIGFKIKQGLFTR